MKTELPVNGVVFVRTYKRYEQVKTHTLKFLEDNDLLSSTILLVADEEELAKYEESLGECKSKLFDIWVTEKGGGRSYNNALKRVPYGFKVFLIDDDIIHLKEHPEKSNKSNAITNLKEYLDYGFDLCKQTDTVMFGFDWSNMFYKQNRGFVTIGMNRISGGFWGGLNCPEFITNYDHEDDNVRSAQVLSKYGRTITFNWIGCKLAPIGTNPGGMQADGSRDKTKEHCEAALKSEDVLKFFEPEPVFKEEYNVYTLKPIGKAKLKKLPYYQKSIEVEEYFGKYEKETKNPLESLF